MTANVEHVDLNLLHTFRVVVDQGGVGRAARVLGRTQPAITSRIRSLLSALGVTLFQRSGRNIVLSPAGRAIDAQVAELLQSANDIVDTARAAQTIPSGALRIGALPTVSTYVLSSHLTRLVDRWDRLSIEVHHGVTEPQVAALLRSELDAVVSVGPPPEDPRLEVINLAAAKPVAVFRRKGAPSAKTVPIATLRELPHYGFGQVGDLFFGAVWSFVERHNLQRTRRIVVAHIQTLKAMVGHSRGYAILPDYTVVEPELAVRKVRGLDFAHPIWMAKRAGRSSPGLDALQAFLSPQGSQSRAFGASSSRTKKGAA